MGRKEGIKLCGYLGGFVAVFDVFEKAIVGFLDFFCVCRKE